MKRVLIITYYWPPSGGSGVQRWLKFVKYLREFAWEPIIYTPENPEAPSLDNSLLKDIPENITIIKKKILEPYLLYKLFVGKSKKSSIKTGFLSEKESSSLKEKVSIWIRSNFFIPDARKFWINSSVRFLNNYLKENHIDVIVSTGPPHSMHIIAKKLKKKNDIPWLADFRDPWTNIDFYDELKLSKRADAKHHKLEFSVLKNSNVVTVISSGMREDFLNIYNRNYDVIPNGFDESDVEKNNEIKLDKKFTIAHIGSMVKSRNPIVFWKSISELINENENLENDIEILLVGSVDFSIKKSIEEFNLKQFVNYVEYLPHDEIIKVQRKTQVLLLIINNTPNAKLVMTSKLFEYMASGRPIICIGPEDGDAAQAIKDTNTGLVSDFEDSKLLKSNILKYYNLFLKNELLINSSNIEKFSRKNLTKNMSELLNRLS